jgi:Methyl-viologen-reducing hydrogenase, delta subunit
MTIKRMRFLQELLAFVGLGDRLHLEWISSAEAQKFVSVVTDFTKKIRHLGPNPVKTLPKALMQLGPKVVPEARTGGNRRQQEIATVAKRPAQTA